MVSASISGAGSAVPAPIRQEELWDEFLAARYAGNDLAARIWRNSGIETRHGVVDPRTEDVSGWSTGARMRRFVQEAMPLGKEALAQCLGNAGVAPDEVGLLAVVSCTGYAGPGLDILLARDLGMNARVQRLHLGHMGCHAALPALAAVSDTVVARGKTAALLCVELSSLHIQPPSDDVDQIVAHALFADAAAAVAVVPDAGGLELVDVAARTDVTESSLMTWDVTDVGFRMGLSREIPAVLARHVGQVVVELLEPHGLHIGDVARWAIHPGGPSILDLVADRLGLDESALEDSREVLRRNGNCSSATVLLILDRIVQSRQLKPGDHIVALAFGPGLTLYATLLRCRAA